MTSKEASSQSREVQSRAWLNPAILSAAVLAMAAGYGAFGVTAVLGDVAEAFGQPVAGDDPVARLGLSTTTLGIGLAIIRLAGLAALPAASLADRYGRRSILWLCGAGLLLTSAAATAGSYWWFVAVVALARPLLSGANTVALVIAAEETHTVDRSKAIAVVEAGYSVGSGAVVIVHGIAAAVLGFRGVLALAAVFLLLYPPLTSRVEETPLFSAERRTRGGGASDLAGAGHRQRLGRVRPELRGRLGVVSLLAGVTAVITGPAFTFLFVYGENVLGVPPSFMAVIVLGAGMMGFLGLLLGRWAADRLGRRVTAGVTTALLAFSATLTYSGSITAMIAGYLSTVTLGGAFGPAAGTLLTELFPTSDRSTASGWAAATGVLGAVVGLALFGALIEVLGSFGLAGGVMWLPLAPMAVLYARLPETLGSELEG